MFDDAIFTPPIAVGEKQPPERVEDFAGPFQLSSVEILNLSNSICTGPFLGAQSDRRNANVERLCYLTYRSDSLSASPDSALDAQRHITAQMQDVRL